MDILISPRTYLDIPPFLVSIYLSHRTPTSCSHIAHVKGTSTINVSLNTLSDSSHP